MAQLQPKIAAMRARVLDVRQKSETAELLERQSENVNTMLRSAALDGSLLAPGGLERAAKALDTEEFAFVTRDEFYDSAAAQIADVLASGEGNVGKLTEFLQNTKDEAGVPLWDRKTPSGGNWSDSFAQAARSGQAVQAKALAEKQANVQADYEAQWQTSANMGRLSDASIYGNADKLGLDGQPRLTFIRHWIDQNQAGIRRLEAEAKAAARHKETIQVLTAGQGLTLETSQLTKAFSKEWTDAVKAGDKRAMGTALNRATAAGIVLPAVKDLIGRTTANNLTQNYATYKAIQDIDPIVASRYVSDDNAVLLEEYNQNRTTFGMSSQEALQAVTRPEQKAVRAEVSTRVGKAATDYFKQNETMPDGSPMPPWMRDRVQAEATRLSMRNPMAPPDVAVSVAFKRVQGDMANVNGRWVPRGGMRTGAEAGVTQFVQRAAKDAVKYGVITEDEQSGVFAMPAPEDPNVYLLMRPDGLPVYSKGANPRPVLFDPNLTAAAVQQWQRDEAEKSARWDQEHKPGVTFAGIDVAQAAAIRTAKGDPNRAPSVTALGGKPEPAGPQKPAPTDLLDYLSTFKR